MRRAFQLPAEDEESLAASGHVWETVSEGQAKWLMIPIFSLPVGYNYQEATVALRIPPSYPDDQIDMAFFSPALALKTGRGIANLSLTTIDERPFQQWSRHRTAANPWRPGLDSICTHLLLVNSWLIKELKR
jgi:hypothetical protein